MDVKALDLLSWRDRMFLPVGVGKIPGASESQLELNYDQTAIELGLRQKSLLRIQQTRQQDKADHDFGN
jgi:hypothetical protein